MIQINEPICQDFEDFLAYMQQKSPALTASMRMKGADCMAINEGLYYKATGVTAKSFHDKFHIIRNFFHISQAMGLVGIKPAKKGHILTVHEDAYTQYKSFNSTEKYFNILKGYAWGCNIEALLGTRPHPMHVETMANHIHLLSTSGKLFSPTNSINGISFQGVVFIHYLGLIDFDYHTKDGYSFEVTHLAVTELGKIILPIWDKERNILIWNKYACKYLTFQDYLPEEQLNSLDEEAVYDYILDKKAEMESAPYFTPFQVLFPDLKRELPSFSNAGAEGVYVFKVTFEAYPKVWRRIALHSSHDFHDFHLAIQKAVKFDNDHLYAFYPEGEEMFNFCYEHPEAAENLPADAITMQDAALVLNKPFTYVFDFGDNWRFMIELEEVREGEKLKSPKVLEQEGKAPKQYGEWG